MNLENLKPGDLIQAEWQEIFVIPSKNYYMLEKSWLRISERRITEPRNIVYYMASYFPEDNDGVQLQLENPFLFFKSNGWIPVQIEQVEKKGDTVTLRLLSISKAGNGE